MKELGGRLEVGPEGPAGDRQVSQWGLWCRLVPGREGEPVALVHL